MPQSITGAQDHSMPKDWMQIRIERGTAADLDKIHIERREAYNDIIKRLIDYWNKNRR